MIEVHFEKILQEMKGEKVGRHTLDRRGTQVAVANEVFLGLMIRCSAQQ
jgi:hypothetical protein